MRVIFCLAKNFSSIRVRYPSITAQGLFDERFMIQLNGLADQIGYHR